MIFKEFQRCFKAKNLPLTLTFETNPDDVDAKYDWSGLTEYFDYIQIDNMEAIKRDIMRFVTLCRKIFGRNLIMVTVVLRKKEYNNKHISWTIKYDCS